MPLVATHWAAKKNEAPTAAVDRTPRSPSPSGLGSVVDLGRNAPLLELLHEIAG